MNDEQVRWFDQDSRFMALLRLLSDLLILNLAMLVTSSLLVTIGASASAGYSVTQRIVTGRAPSSILRCYWQAFRENLRQSTALFLILLLAGIVLASDFYFGLRLLPSAWGVVLTCFFGGMLLVWYGGAMLVLPLSARFENSLTGHLKNGYILAIRHPKTVLLLWLVRLLPVFFVLAFERSSPMMVLLVCAGGGSLVLGLSTLCQQELLQIKEIEV